LRWFGGLRGVQVIADAEDPDENARERGAGTTTTGAG
jgi:hypothetical protein